ncbi:hypothetical protein SK128_003907, partial [Halocaridina rubra]
MIPELHLPFCHYVDAIPIPSNLSDVMTSPQNQNSVQCAETITNAASSLCDVLSSTELQLPPSPPPFQRTDIFDLDLKRKSMHQTGRTNIDWECYYSFLSLTQGRAKK